MFSKFSVQVFKVCSRFNHSSAAAAVHPLYSIKVDVPPPNQIEATELLESSTDYTKYETEIAKPSDTNRILNFLEKNFFCDEPLCRSLNLCNTKIDKFLEFHIKSILSQGMSLIARENSPENQVVGVCVNQRNCKWNGDHLEDLAKITKNQNMQKLLRIWALLSREPAMHDHLAQHNIFDLAFISVKQEHQEVAAELTKHSLALARDMNFSFARIDCTNNETMKIAKNFDMEKLWEVAYKNILSDVDKKPIAILEPPNTHAAAYFINLKAMPIEMNDLESKLTTNPIYDEI